MDIYDVVILGGGPGGLAAAVSAHDYGARVLIVEREQRLGGILKQCIHDGFGLIRFKERLSGPEYSEKYINMVYERKIPLSVSTFATEISNMGASGFVLTLVNSSEGVFQIGAKALVLATGCRERTSKQVFIQGTRPSGVYTAGTAQHLVNIEGYLPCKRCVILGSGDIGLIMARRLKLEGAEVLGVYEAKSTPSGLSRNIAQCLEDFSIPLYLSRTITKIYGSDRVEGVEICRVDEDMNPIAGTEEKVECDGVILSVGLIPENETAEKLGIKIDPSTRGPFVDQDLMTGIPGVFSCGNSLHVNDLVDYVSESGEIAGRGASKYSKSPYNAKLIPVKADFSKFLYVVPQYINVLSSSKKAIIYFRPGKVTGAAAVEIRACGSVLSAHKYKGLRPPELERLEIDLENVLNEGCSSIEIVMEEG